MPTKPENAHLKLLDREQLTALLDASSLLTSTLDSRRVLNSLMELTNRLLHTEACSLLLIDERGKRLMFKSTAGAKANEVMRFTLDADKGIVGWVIRNKKPYIAHDVTADAEWSHEVSEMLGFPTRSILCVPIILRDRLLGALEAINKKDDGTFDAADVALLTTLANHAAIALENARRHAELEADARNMLDQIRRAHTLVGAAPLMKGLMETIRKVTPSDSTLLIRGESGTGKELIARTIHYDSPRRAKPFTCVNCTLYSETLIESELFGHEQGAFTGAAKRRIGRFEQGDGGTIFLDEVGSISPEGQMKLLRVLQDREFERLGGSETIRVNVRIIAATNEDLEKAIAGGKFREDLYYRLKVIEITAPPLRERASDIPALIAHFLEEHSARGGRGFAGVNPEAMELLKAYRWPGNVRELNNVIERAVVLGSGDTLLPEHLPPEIAAPSPEKRGGLTLEDAERERIVQTLEGAGGNKSLAAKTLGISRNRLDRKLKAYGIASPR
jgi:Nif-specific regulatory protein